MARVAVNGLGRIGRATLKIVMETSGLDLVAVNELASAANVVYLLKYDSVYGRHDKPVAAACGRVRMPLVISFASIPLTSSASAMSDR